MRRKITGRIEEWGRSEYRHALTVHGPRGVGKTHVIDEYCRTHYRHYLRIDFSEDSPVHAVFDRSLMVDQLIFNLSCVYPDFDFVPYETILFFDEIQCCPDARTALKPLAEDGRYRVITASSNPDLNIRRVRLLPMGRESFEHMGPMDFEEFLWAVGCRESPVMERVRDALSRCEPMGILADALMDRFRTYMMVGGMPEAVAAYLEHGCMAPVRRKQREILERWISDLRDHPDSRFAGMTEACLLATPAMLRREGRRFDFGEAVPDAGPDAFDERMAAIRWLEATGMAVASEYKSPGNALSWATVHPGDVRLYISDPGILALLLGDDCPVGLMRGDAGVAGGALAEATVASQIRWQGRSVWHCLDPDGGEADLLLSLGDGACAVMVDLDGGRSESLPAIVGKLMLGRNGFGGMVFWAGDCHVDGDGIRRYPMFAASFMDIIDPPWDMKADFSDVEELNRLYAEESTDD